MVTKEPAQQDIMAKDLSSIGRTSEAAGADEYQGKSGRIEILQTHYRLWSTSKGRGLHSRFRARTSFPSSGCPL